MKVLCYRSGEFDRCAHCPHGEEHDENDYCQQTVCQGEGGFASTYCIEVDE